MERRSAASSPGGPDAAKALSNRPVTVTASGHSWRSSPAANPAFGKLSKSGCALGCSTVHASTVERSSTSTCRPAANAPSTVSGDAQLRVTASRDEVIGWVRDMPSRRTSTKYG